MTIRLLAAALAFFASVQALGQTEIILDNDSAAFATAGTWPASTSVSGFIGSNYQTHEANGAPPGAIAVDNTEPEFSVTGTWISSTAVSGYLGSNYQHHYANGEPPTSVVADNLAGSFSGTWPTSTSVGGYYATNYQHHAAGTGTSSFTWTLNAPAAGTYEAYARWTQHPNRATNAKYTVNHAGGADVVTVNQEVGDGNWQLLGTYSFNAGATTVSLSDDADGYVIADAVMLAPPGAAPNTATWSATIPSSGSFEVFARWTQHPNRASNAKYTVNHAGGSTQVIVNQMAGGGTWSSLGTFNFDAGTASISLTDQADGYVIADAVMFLPPGSSPNSATWTPNVVQAGQYEVYAQWTQHANRATDATYTVTHAGGSTPVAVNQQANGGVWNLLGTFTLSPGTAHNVTLTDQANGYVIADAIRLVPVAIQAEQKLYFVHADHLNTPRLVADATGTTVWRWDQGEPFGNNPADENPSGLGAFDLPLRLPGQRYDAETGLHYNYFRDYDPALARYTSADPLGTAAGPNLYAYVWQSPLRFIDLFGLECWWDDQGKTEICKPTGIRRQKPTHEYTSIDWFPIPDPSSPSIGVGVPGPMPTPGMQLLWRVVSHEKGYWQIEVDCYVPSTLICSDDCGKVTVLPGGRRPTGKKWERGEDYDQITGYGKTQTSGAPSGPQDLGFGDNQKPGSTMRRPSLRFR